MSVYIEELEWLRDKNNSVRATRVIKVARNKELHRLSLQSDAEAVLEGEEAIHAVWEELLDNDSFIDDEDGEGM